MEVAGAALLLGRTPDAIGLIDQATSAAPDSWAAWNDRSVIHLSMASGPDQAHELALALDAAHHSTSLAPNQAAPWLNLSIVASRLSLTSTAKAARATFLSIEHDPAWRVDTAEPRASAPAPVSWDAVRADLVKPGAIDEHSMITAARELPGLTRDAVLNDLLPAWSNAVRSGRTSDAAVLESRAKALGAALREIDGDAFVADCTRRASAVFHGKSSQAAVGMLATAHLEYREGRLAYDTNRRAEAEDHFRKSAGAFRKSMSPCELLPKVDLGVAAYQRSQAASARGIYERVQTVARARGYHSLFARASLLEGLVLLDVGRAEQAQPFYDAAIATYERGHDIDHWLGAQSSAADSLRRLGAHRQGWRALSTALLTRNRNVTARQRYLILYNTSLYSADDDLPHAALVFEDEALIAARERGTPNLIVEALVQRARRYLQLNQPELATADLDTASGLAPSIQSASSALYENAWLTRVRAESLIRSQPLKARGLIDDALIQYFSHRERGDVPSLYLARGRAASVARRFDLAVEDFAAGAAAVEALSANLSVGRFQASYLDAAWDVFEEQIRLDLVTAGGEERAFADAERARGRLLDSRPSGTADVSARSVARRLPAGMGLLYYVSLPEELIVWRLSRDGVQVVHAPVARTALGRSVSAYRRLIEAGRAKAELEPLGTQLCQWLIDARWLDEHHVSTLLIVPDGALHALPFAALITPNRREFLTERTAVGIVPSAAWFMNSNIVSPSPADRGETRALLVGAAVGSPEWPSLPETAEELRDVGDVYRRPAKMVGADATPTSFARSVDQFDVVHFAGHAKADLMFPWSSFLLLSPDASHPSGALRGDEIEAWRLPRHPLVVLGACETAYGTVFRGAGVASLATPFLHAGASAVVGSLWSVDDKATRVLMQNFHQAYRKRTDAIVGLHEAQLRLLRGADPSEQLPRTWGAFIAVGR